MYINRYEQFGATRASSRGRLLRGRLVARVHRLFRSWATFFSNPFVLVNLSSCVLHASLLVNGPQVLSYLRWAQVPPISIGIVWIAAAVCAFVGEGIAVTTHRCTGSLTKTGFLLLCLFASSIVLAGMAFNGMFIDSLGLSEALLAVCAIAFSRGFYEAYSLTQMQLVQEHIEDDLLYYVLSTQSSVMFMCLITSQAVTIAIPNPADFSQLVSFSVASVLIATLSYVGWYTCYDRGPYQVVDEIGRLKLDVPRLNSIIIIKEYSRRVRMKQRWTLLVFVLSKERLKNENRDVVNVYFSLKPHNVNRNKVNIVQASTSNNGGVYFSDASCPCVRLQYAQARVLGLGHPAAAARGIQGPG